MSGVATPISPAKVTRADILVAASVYFGLPISEFKTQSRVHVIAHKRQVVMYVARRLTRKSLPDIGARLGGRDHTTVLHAVRRVEERLGCASASEKAANTRLETECAIVAIEEMANAIAVRRRARIDDLLFLQIEADLYEQDAGVDDGCAPDLLDLFWDEIA